MVYAKFSKIGHHLVLGCRFNHYTWRLNKIGESKVQKDYWIVQTDAEKDEHV